MPNKKPRISRKKHYKNKNGGYTTTFKPKQKKRLKMDISLPKDMYVFVLGSEDANDVYRITEVLEEGKLYTCVNLKTGYYFEIPSDELKPYPIQKGEKYYVLVGKSNFLYEIEDIEWDNYRKCLIVSMDSGEDAIYPDVQEVLREDYKYKFYTDG